jgi:hypothetical protein
VTEQDKSIIYEWAYPNLAELYRDGEIALPRLRPLDMNFAFDVCIPKLDKEGYSATCSPEGWWFYGNATGISFVGQDFYKDCLLAYIKGNPHA